MSLSQPKAQPPIDVLRDVLASGVTGRLALGPPRPVHIFCMHGAILAAHAPDDGTWMVRRLVNNGAITQRQGEAFARSVEQGRSAEELLLGHVPDQLFHRLLRARFEENLLALFEPQASTRFVPMDALFVRNIQVGHDTRELLGFLQGRHLRVGGLRGRVNSLTLRPGPSMPATKDEARILDLCEPAISLVDLLSFSPFEEGASLDAVLSMLDSGALVSDEGIRLVEGATGPTAAQPPPEQPAPEQPASAAPAFGRPQEPAPPTSRSVDDDFAVEELFSLDERQETPPAASPAQAPPVATEAPTDDLDSDVEHDAPLFDDDAPFMEETWSHQGGEVVSMVPVQAPPEPQRPQTLGPDTLGPEPVGADQKELAAADPAAADPAAAAPPTAKLTQPADLLGDPDPTEQAPRPDASNDGFHGGDFGQPELDPFAVDDGPSPAPSGGEPVARPQHDLAAFGDGDDLSEEEAALFGGGLDEAPAAAAFFEGQETDGDDAEMSMFVDQDHYRGRGQGQFTLGSELLDVVDLREEAIRRGRPLPEPPEPTDDGDEILEALGAEDTELTEEDKVVSLRFGAPRLGDEELYSKLEVCNDVLAAVARSLERNRPGSGVSSIQLLLDGTPSSYAGLFHGLTVRGDGTFGLDDAATNLERRPDSERRSLLDRGIMDLIERSLSFAVEELPDPDMDALLMDIAGYQQRLRR